MSLRNWQSNTVSHFLSVQDVLKIHNRMILEFGGDASVRDTGLLDSALAMPKSQFADQMMHPDIPSQAAAYLFHICKNHPFVDGNKRTALAACEVFILCNTVSTPPTHSCWISRSA